MFGPPGMPTFRSYGIHWCLNFVCEPEGVATGILIRALEPVEGLEAMAARRGVGDTRLLCSGPGRLCQALGVTGAHDGLPLDRPPFELSEAVGRHEIAVGPRVGLTKAVEQPWRYGRRLAVPEPALPGGLTSWTTASRRRPARRSCIQPSPSVRCR